MRRVEPPPTATWLLEHLTPGPANEALAGDLLEELQTGRTAGWYWYQVLFAIALGWGRELFAHQGLVLFAVLWSLAAPSWYVFLEVQHVETAYKYACRLAFPFSMMGYILWSLIASLSFLWMGCGLFLLFRGLKQGNYGNLQLTRRLVLSVCVFVGLSTVMCILSAFVPHGGSFDWRTLTVVSAITDPRMGAMQARFFSLVTLLVALRAGTSPLLGKNGKTVA